MGQLLKEMASQAAGGVIGAGMGLLMEGHNDRRQLEQQKKLQELQMAGSKDMAEFNRKQQMKLWEDTNYKAQMAQLKLAGLNPGLIYGMSGGGGATAAAAQGSSPTGANAPMGGGEGMALIQAGAERAMQLRLLQAQKENIEADTANKRGDAANKPLVGANLSANTELAKIEAQIKNIDAEIKGRTIEDAIDIITAEAGRATFEALRTQRQNNIEQATMDATMTRIKAESIGALLRNANTQADTRLKGAQTTTEQEKPTQIRAETDAIATSIVQHWRQLELEGKRITNDEIRRLTEGANISDQVLDGIQTILLLRAAGKTGRPTEIKGFRR